MTGSDRVRTRNRFPRFFLTIVVVQNVSLRITGSNMATGYDVTECHVTRRGSLEGYAHVHPEVAQYPPQWGLFTGNDVIKRHPQGFPWKIWERECATGSVIGVLSRTSASYNLIICYELALSLVICPFPAILCSWGAPSIITQPFFRLFSAMFEVLYSTPRVFSISSAFPLWYFY